MTSQAIRDPFADHLITPQNAAFVFIDYQPEQLDAVRSMEHERLVENAVSTVTTVKTFGVPVVHSTVNVASGQVQSTLPELAELLTDDPPLDRTTVNSWEDTEFVQAVHCDRAPKAHPVRIVDRGLHVDAIGGTSVEAHRAALERVAQAGAQPLGLARL